MNEIHLKTKGEGVVNIPLRGVKRNNVYGFLLTAGFIKRFGNGYHQN